MKKKKRQKKKNNVVLVSGIHQSDSVTHIHVSTAFQILFPFRLLNNIEQGSLCYNQEKVLVGYPFEISILCMSLPNSPSLPSLLLFHPVTLSVFCKSVSLFLF